MKLTTNHTQLKKEKCGKKNKEDEKKEMKKSSSRVQYGTKLQGLTRTSIQKLSQIPIKVTSKYNTLKEEKKIVFEFLVSCDIKRTLITSQ